MSLLPVAQAQAQLLAMAGPLAEEDAPLSQSCGRWTTREVLARRSQPAADLSAMDGYAIRFADMPGPWRVVGESAAGSHFAGLIGNNEAVRIYTGAMMPQGADTVLVQEDSAREDERLRLSGDGPESLGRHVRRAGFDFSESQPVIPSGTRLSPRDIALAALAGHGSLTLPRLPRIALVSTGSELVQPGIATGPDQLPASNAIMLQAMLGSLPCTALDQGIVADNLDALAETFAAAAGTSDIVVSTGGASVGDHDLVKPALERAGGRIDFWKIGMRPGKPLICGRIGNAIFIGLPGNPVSAFVTATLFLLPLVRHMAGSPNPLPQIGRALLDCDMPAVGGRDDYVRGTTSDGRAAPLPVQDSAATLSLARADCLIVRPAGSNQARAGDEVKIIAI